MQHVFHPGLLGRIVHGRVLWLLRIRLRGAFCHMAKLPAAPNALSDAGYMFTLSGADLIRDIYAYCSELAECHVFDAAEVKPGNVIKLVLRLFLIDGFGAMPA